VSAARADRLALRRAEAFLEAGQWELAAALLAHLLSEAAPAQRAAIWERLACLETARQNCPRAIHCYQQVIAESDDPVQIAWCLRLLLGLYRRVGLKRERFQVGCELMLTLRRIALSDPEVDHRIYALSELVREMEERDLPDEAAKYEKILRHFRDQRAA
jgi:hypothetical protein